VSTTTTNPDPAQLSGWELSKQVAAVAGWRALRQWREPGDWWGYRPGADFECPLAAYHESLDACFRDLMGEVETRKRTWTMGRYFTRYIDTPRFIVQLHLVSQPADLRDPRGSPWGDGDSPAEAFCHAWLEMVKQHPTLEAKEPATNASP
jgi:hypothetical protein